MVTHSYKRLHLTVSRPFLVCFGGVRALKLEARNWELAEAGNWELVAGSW